MDYGYSGEVLLTSVLRVPRGLKAGPTVKLSAQVRWLVCKDICVPGQAGLTLLLPAKDSATSLNPKRTDLFKTTHRKLPKTMPKDWKISGDLNPNEFRLSFETDQEVSNASFFPSHPGEIENAAPQTFHSTGKTFQMGLKRSEQLLKNIPSLEGLLVVVTEKSGEQVGYSIKVPLSVSR
jgi:thiol:disulfide interchange protein DsbD